MSLNNKRKKSHKLSKNTCKWYFCCPINHFVKRGLLEKEWIEKYCLIGNKDCVRYHMEEIGKFHPDNILPNGDIREDLR